MAIGISSQESFSGIIAGPPVGDEGLQQCRGLDITHTSTYIPTNVVAITTVTLIQMDSLDTECVMEMVNYYRIDADEMTRSILEVSSV